MQTMKTPKFSLFFPALLVAAIVSTAGISLAAPPGKGPQFHRAKTAGEISSIKKGDKYVEVCLKCQTATVQEATDDATGEKLCHDGGDIHCPSCKKTFKIKRVGPPGKTHISKVEVKYLNADGEECMVLIPLKEKE